MPWVGSAASTHPDGDPQPQVCPDGDGYDSGVTTRQSAAMSEALAMVAPGQPLRDGLDRIAVGHLLHGQVGAFEEAGQHEVQRAGDRGAIELAGSRARQCHQPLDGADIEVQSPAEPEVAARHSGQVPQ